MSLAASVLVVLFCALVLYAAVVLPMAIGGGRYAWRLLEFVEAISAGIDIAFRRGAAAWFEPVTADFDEVDGVRCAFASGTGALMTLIRVRGVSKVQDAEEIGARINTIQSGLSSYFATGGHFIQVRFAFDPEGGDALTTRVMDPLRRSAQRLRLDIDFLLENWSRRLGQFVADQDTFVAVWTTSGALSTSMQRREASRARAEASNGVPMSAHAANVHAALPSLRAPHAAYVRSTLEAFREAGILADLLDVHTAARVMRRSVVPDTTPDQWRPVLAGDPLRPRANLRPDASGALYPTLAEQIFPVSPLKEGEFIVVGNRRYAFVYMSLWPQQPKPFGSLIAALQRSGTPHIVSFLLSGDALGGTGLKSSLASVFQFGSENNKMLVQGLEEIQQRILRNETMVGAQAVFATWTSVDEAPRRLRERQAALAGAIASWGSCEPSSVIGDAALAFTATMPGATMRSPAPRTPAPLDEIVPMLPIERAAPLWEDGGVLYRAGPRLFPYRQGSSLQSAPVVVGFASMGGGKSVNIGISNLGFVLESDALPYLSISDIGPSSKGFIKLLQMALPAHEQHLAQYHRLRYEPRFTTNVFDLPLGGDRPLPSHEKFLVNFLCVLCGTASGATDEAIPGLATACVKAVYEDRLPVNQPRRYSRGVNSEVDAVLGGLGVEIHPYTTWYDVRDVLFDAGQLHAATLAQRYAVPTLSEVASRAQDAIISSSYKKEVNGESITYFFFRKIAEAIQRIPILDGASRFSLDDARVIALDLDEVAPNSGGEASGWLAAVAVMLSRHLLASRFFLMPEDAALFPTKYREFQRERITRMRESPKKLVYDELQRFSQNAAVVGQFVADAGTMVREGRKWNLYLEFYSQLISHIPDDIVKLSFTRYVFGGSRAEIIEAGKKLHLSDAAQAACLRIGKPGRHGANFVAAYRVAGLRDGESVQFLTSTTGPFLLWALETSPKNAAVRDRLYDRWGVRRTIEILGQHYPGGVEEAVVAMAKELGDDDDGAIQAMVAKIVERFDAAAGAAA
ncbi:MAG: hypothetical protein HKL99_14185 [Burkholderiales bacterium]|nr:hypothetical protein [Burkholderiales bacterium]